MNEASGNSSAMKAEDLIDGTIFEIVRAAAADSSTLSSARDLHFRLGSGAVLYPEAAILLWERMVSLPQAGQMRCHNPRFGIHLNFGRGRFYTAAICWECNNISISSSGIYSWQMFDGQSVAAKSLLADVRKYAPEADGES